MAITKTDVKNAMLSLTTDTNKPTIADIRTKLGNTGSLSTISKFKREIDEEQQLKEYGKLVVLTEAEKHTALQALDSILSERVKQMNIINVNQREDATIEKNELAELNDTLTKELEEAKEVITKINSDLTFSNQQLRFVEDERKREVSECRIKLEKMTANFYQANSKMELLEQMKITVKSLETNNDLLMKQNAQLQKDIKK